MLQAKQIPPAKPEPTYDITGLSATQMRELLRSLKHCSGGHLEDSCCGGVSVPGTLYNQADQFTGS